MGEVMACHTLVKKLHPEACVTWRGPQITLYADCEAWIEPGKRVRVGTGVALMPPPGHGAYVMREGKVGLQRVDGDFVTEVAVAFHNTSRDRWMHVKVGQELGCVVTGC